MWKVLAKLWSCSVLCPLLSVVYSALNAGGGVGTPYSGLYGEAPLTVYKRVGKIAILVYQRVTKSAAKWKKWWLKRTISKGATFWQK